MPALPRGTLQSPDLWRASTGFSLVWVVHLGRRFGLLHVLARESKSLPPAAIARQAGIDEKAASLWCEAAAALGLLSRTRSGFRLPPRLVPLLLQHDHPGYLGGHLSYLALRSLDFDSFDEFFRQGPSAVSRQRHLSEAFGEATQFDHTAFLALVLPRVPALERQLSEGCAVLDVGAGAGSWEFRVAPRFVNSSFVGLERNRASLELAMREAERRNLGARVKFVAGNGEKMRFVEQFDVVYLGEMLCAAQDPARVLARCRRSLRRGGFIVICEGLVVEFKGRAQAENQVILPMQLEFALQPARFFGKRELRTLLQTQGFAGVKFIPAGGGLWFAVARR